MEKLKKYWNKLYNTKKHKYTLKNLKFNCLFYKEAYDMFNKNPLDLYTIEYLMNNINPNKNKFDYIQKKQFFEIIKYIENSKEFKKYQKQYTFCKKNGIDISNFIEIIY
jgi:hypothetical protein